MLVEKVVDNLVASRSIRKLRSRLTCPARLQMNECQVLDTQATHLAK
jgi:hypothetical protein